MTNLKLGGKFAKSMKTISIEESNPNVFSTKSGGYQ